MICEVNAETCGIFGFALKKPVPLPKVFRVLQKLEVHQYPQEPRPVGGYGAGIAVFNVESGITLEKVGAINPSPAKSLSEIVQINEATILIGHVRMPSPEFMDTAQFTETAQPYLTKCNKTSMVVSAHNGKAENYMEIRGKLGEPHAFESEKVGLIDSEVIPHFFEELLKQRATVEEARDALFTGLEGSNAISLLQIEEANVRLHFIHKGRTRGLTIWKNGQDELIFCSRKEPLMDEFEDIIESGRFKEVVSIPYREDINFRESFALKLN
jgi:glucosamine 6-phosphate synthetase-like amidotransferase/phosphosugar isomerase protein